MGVLLGEYCLKFFCYGLNEVNNGVWVMFFENKSLFSFFINFGEVEEIEFGNEVFFY